MSYVPDVLERERRMIEVEHRVDQHRAALEAFVRARVPASKVEDVLQAASLRAIERRLLEEPSRVRAWLHRIVRPRSILRR